MNKFDTYNNIQILCELSTLEISNPVTRPSPISDGHHSSLRNKSVSNPQNKDNKHIEVFQNMILGNLHRLKVKKLQNPSWIKRGIEKLEKKKDLVIHPADGGRRGKDCGDD